MNDEWTGSVAALVLVGRTEAPDAASAASVWAPLCPSRRSVPSPPPHRAGRESARHLPKPRRPHAQ